MRTLRPLAAAVAAGLLLVGCGQDAPTATTDGATSPGRAGATTTPDAVVSGPAPAPAEVTPAPAEEVWGLAQLVPPEGLSVTSSLRRPDPAGLASFLLVGTTTTDGAAALCDQLGGATPVPAAGLTRAELSRWELAEPPPGELVRCSAPEPVVPSVQRDVLVAATGDAATVWVAAYDTPATP